MSTAAFANDVDERQRGDAVSELRASHRAQQRSRTTSTSDSEEDA